MQPGTLTVNGQGHSDQVEWINCEPVVYASRVTIAMELAASLSFLVLIALGGTRKILAALTLSGPPGQVGVLWLFVFVSALFAFLAVRDLGDVIVKLGVSQAGLLVIRRVGTELVPWTQLRHGPARTSGVGANVYYWTPSQYFPSLDELVVPLSVARRVWADARFPRAQLE